MKPLHKTALVAFGLLAAGAVRVPLELALAKDLREAALLSEPLSIDARERIGQTSFAVALGGLRTLVATFLNLRAYTAFSEQRWGDVEETFNTIVDLAPHTGLYWETGAWHLSYNAASYYQLDSDLPALRRRELWRAYIEKGRLFLERAIRNNPDDWSLHANLGKLLSDPYKLGAFQDRDASFAAAAAAYRAASETGKAPGYVTRSWFYTLARVPGKEAEALALGERLYQSSTQTPTLLALLFVLRMHADPGQDAMALALRLFRTDERAYHALSAIWLGKNDFYPVDGVAAVLQSLEKRLSIPWENSAFNPNR